MISWPVSARVGNVKNKDAGLIESLRQHAAQSIFKRSSSNLSDRVLGLANGKTQQEITAAQQPQR